MCHQRGNQVKRSYGRGEGVGLCRGGRNAMDALDAASSVHGTEAAEMSTQEKVKLKNRVAQKRHRERVKVGS